MLKLFSISCHRPFEDDLTIHPDQNLNDFPQMSLLYFYLKRFWLWTAVLQFQRWRLLLTLSLVNIFYIICGFLLNFKVDIIVCKYCYIILLSDGSLWHLSNFKVQIATKHYLVIWMRPSQFQSSDWRKSENILIISFIFWHLSIGALSVPLQLLPHIKPLGRLYLD